jgi:hypothetical protein
MPLTIRTYRLGDEDAQARIYNATAAALPGFKPATPGEVARRFPADGHDPASRFYAVDDAGAVVGYALFNPGGRVGYPWCLAGHEPVQEPLIEAVVAAMATRGHAEAWAAYRHDWGPVLAFFHEHGFAPAREMVNFVTETAALPTTPVPQGLAVGPLGRVDLPELLRLGRGLFTGSDPGRLGDFLWANPGFGPDSLFALRSGDGGGEVVGVALVVVRTGYADPLQLDAAMPCFRLGAFGTERERHKRVNGMISCVITRDEVGEALLAEARRRLVAAGLTHAAAQAPSDQAELVRLHERFFRRQGAFPILSRPLAGRPG